MMKPYLLLSVILLLLGGSPKQGESGYEILPDLKAYKPGLKNSSHKDKFRNDFNRLSSDYISSYLILDHLFVYNNPTVNYTISVKGKIPVYYDIETAGVIYIMFPNGRYKVPVYNLFGKGTVTISGKGNMKLGQFEVKKINYESSMTVNIRGKTNWRKMPSDGSVIELMYLALEENWNGDFKWDIVTSDPKNDAIRYDMLKQVVPKKIPDSPHTGHTIEYVEGYLYEPEVFESNSSIPGMGTFRWRYTRTYEGIDEKDRVDVNPKNLQLNFDDNYPLPYEYVKYHKAVLGPPLESINWKLADIDD